MYNNNINEIHKFPSFVFGEINSHQTWGVQMGTIRGYSVHKPRNISRDYPPTHCWLKCPFQGKQAAPPLQPLKRWKTQTLGALETTLDNIRNRDHSVHIYIYIGNVIIPTDEVIFFRGVGQPPTSQDIQAIAARTEGFSGREPRTMWMALKIHGGSSCFLRKVAARF